jgi:hypothetical protein
VRKDSIFLVTRNHNCHAYGIPAVWQKFSNKVFGDDIKYQDYMESVEMDFTNQNQRN